MGILGRYEQMSIRFVIDADFRIYSVTHSLTHSVQYVEGGGRRLLGGGGSGVGR